MPQNWRASECDVEYVAGQECDNKSKVSLGKRGWTVVEDQAMLLKEKDRNNGVSVEKLVFLEEAFSQRRKALEDHI